MNKDLQERINRGDRLQDYRKSLKLNLDDFAQLFQVGKSTLGHWEHARGSGLSSKGAKAIAKRSQELYEQDQIKEPTSYLWLYYGTFEQPDQLTSNFNNFSGHFLKNNHNASIIEIHDNQHAPFLSQGDFVAVVSIPLANNKPINHLCLSWEDQHHFQLVFVDEIVSSTEIIATPMNLGAASTKKRLTTEKLDLILWMHKPYLSNT